MDNFLFTIDKDKNTQNQELCYTVVGKEDFLDTEGLPRVETKSVYTMAKIIITSSNTRRFFIKVYGNNKLFNPVSPINDETKPSIIDNTCKLTNNKFMPVNETVFNYYMQFLTTKNVLWLQKAERERI